MLDVNKLSKKNGVLFLQIVNFGLQGVGCCGLIDAMLKQITLK